MLKSTRLLQSYACSLLSQGPLCLFSFFRLPWISFTSSPSQLHTTPLRIFGEMHVCIFNEMSYFQRIENGCTELCLQCARGSTLVSFSLSAMPPQLPSSLCKHFHSFPFRPLTNHCWSPLKPQPTTFTLSHLPTTVSLPWCTSLNPSRRPLFLAHLLKLFMQAVIFNQRFRESCWHCGRYRQNSKHKRRTEWRRHLGTWHNGHGEEGLDNLRGLFQPMILSGKFLIQKLWKVWLC